MSDSCHRIEDLLPDFLDDVLDRPLQKRVEQHLASCRKCRDNLELQRQWLLQRDQLMAAKYASTVPAGINQRIMAAVHAERVSYQTSAPQKRASILLKPWVWRSLSGTAAAVIVLVIVLQFLPNRLASTAKTSDDQSGNAALTTAACLTTANRPAATEATPQFTKSAGGWTIISGQPFDLMILNSMIVAENGTQADSAASALYGIANLPENARGSVIDALSQSADVRVMFRLLPQQETIILAAFDDNQVNIQAEQIKNALAPCETPIQIEIISTDDLQAKMASLDPALFDEVFSGPMQNTSWIFILIGA